MQKSFPVLSTAFLLSAISSHAIEEEAEFESTPIEENLSEEVAALEPTLLFQQSTSSSELTSSGELDLSSPLFIPHYKSSVLAVGLANLLPGLGHVYLGDYKTAAYLFGSAALLVGSSYVKAINNVLDGSNVVAVQSVALYSIYASYRDVRAFNENLGYCYKMPTESFADLASAPFRWSVLKKPEVWGGLLGALALGAGLTYFAASKETSFSLNLSSSMAFPLVAFPIGIGEESFFRGYLQSSLSEYLNPWGGILASSLVFGAMHIPNAYLLEPQERKHYYAMSLPFITAFGVYFGWLTHKNHSLKESVALHSWYDFFIFLGSYSAAQSAAVGKPSFAVSFSF